MSTIKDRALLQLGIRGIRNAAAASGSAAQQAASGLNVNIRTGKPDGATVSLIGSHRFNGTMSSRGKSNVDSGLDLVSFEEDALNAAAGLLNDMQAYAD